MDAQGIISSKQQAATASIASGTTAIAPNRVRSSWAIQNQGTAVLYVLMGGGAGPTGQIKAWTGVAWVAKPVKVWSGVWTTKTLKYWNGASWITTPY